MEPRYTKLCILGENLNRKREGMKKKNIPWIAVRMFNLNLKVLNVFEGVEFEVHTVRLAGDPLGGEGGAGPSRAASCGGGGEGFRVFDEEGQCEFALCRVPYRQCIDGVGGSREYFSGRGGRRHEGDEWEEDI